MRPEHFQNLLHALLEQSGDEHLKQVRTFAEAGFHKPSGLEITATDGWTTHVQLVRTSPPGGDSDGYTPTVDLDAGKRPANPLPTERHGRPQPPTLKVHALEALIRRVVADAARPEVEKVETYAEAGIDTKPAGVRVTFTNGAVIYAMFVGVAAPGEHRIGHREYDIPKELI